MSQPIHINPTLIASPNWSEVSCWTGEKARIMASSLVCQDWVNWHLPSVDELLLMKEDERVILRGNEYWVRTDSGMGVYSIPYREVFHEIVTGSSTGRQAYVRAVQTEQIPKEEPISESDEVDELPSSLVESKNVTELTIEFINTLLIGTEQDTVVWPTVVTEERTGTRLGQRCWERMLSCGTTFNPNHEVTFVATLNLDDDTSFWVTTSFKVTYVDKTKSSNNSVIIEITNGLKDEKLASHVSLQNLCYAILEQEERLSDKRAKDKILRSLACLKQVVNKE